MEKVVSNIDVLWEIFQYLNLEELLKLTRVCSQFRTVIADFMWRNKYKQVEISKITQYFGMLLTSTHYTHPENYEEESEIGFECIRKEKAILNKAEVDTFLQLIVNNIRTLVLSSPTIIFYARKSVGDEKQTIKKNCEYFFFKPAEFGVTFDKRQNFVNLTDITFRHVTITDRDLRLLNESSRNLEKICLDNCFNINEEMLIVGDDIKMTTLQKMKHLKDFQILVFDSVDKDLSYDINKLLRKLSVAQFVIKVRNFAIIEEDDTEMQLAVKTAAKTCCEDLTIGYFRSQRIFRKFNNTILSNFINLKKLVLESWALISINEEFFKKLTRNCGQLECLKLQNFEINGFAVVSTLNTLVLENCTGLIWRDLKTMLSEMKLKEFSISDTEYIGIFEYFNVASTLENVLVINCQRNHLKKLFDINNGQNLKTLTTLVWHDNFAQAPVYVATSCPKLRTLITESSSLLINNLYSLNRLEKLTLRVGRKIKFSKIIIILKHVNLKHFTLTKLRAPDGYDESNDYLIDYDIYDQELLEFEGKKINLTFVNISLNSYFKIVQDFWFNLLESNPNLTLMIRYNRCLHNDHSFLKFIINHRKFPKRLKVIKICGYIMEIKEFKKNFEIALEKVKSFSNIYKDEEEKGYILF